MAARGLAARAAAVRRGQRRRPLRGRVRERAVRPRARRVHRRQDRSRGALRAGRRRHALPRRDRQHVAGGSRRSCCACCRRASSSRSARRGRGASTCASSRRRTPTCGRRSPRGRFREDLLFRLNTIEIELPPLRERREDIPAPRRATFSSGTRRATGRPCHASTRARMQALLAHCWPGNVRELDHAVERARAARARRPVRAGGPRPARRASGRRAAARRADARRGGAQAHRTALARYGGNVSQRRARRSACRAARSIAASRRIGLGEPPDAASPTVHVSGVPAPADPAAAVTADEQLQPDETTPRSAALALLAASSRASRCRCLRCSGSWRTSARGCVWTLVTSSSWARGWRSRLAPARARRAPAADALQPARRAARGRLLDPRASAPTATTRSVSRCSNRTLLGETLRAQRLGAIEATALLAHGHGGDRRRRVRVRRRGARCARQSRGRTPAGAAVRATARPRAAEQSGSPTCSRARRRASMDVTLAGGRGRWEVRRGLVPAGRPAAHAPRCSPTCSRTLREEELQAWQRLVRVLSHEINNSLAPIQSIAGSLRGAARSDRRAPPDARRRHLGAASASSAARSEALVPLHVGRTRGSRSLPPPNRAPLDVAAWVRRVGGARDAAARCASSPGPAADASRPTAISSISCSSTSCATPSTRARDAAAACASGGRAATATLDAAWCDDEGPGLAATANLFVPFFTTKPQGSGIGLVLSRQIAEAHGGSLSLANRSDRRGCVATVRLELASGPA